MYIFTNNGWIMTTTNDRPDLSPEGAPDIGKTVNVKLKSMSGHETQMGLESRTY
jgi:LmbE family N-acetylglucosaminyl deacetylase